MTFGIALESGNKAHTIARQVANEISQQERALGPDTIVVLQRGVIEGRRVVKESDKVTRMEIFGLQDHEPTLTSMQEWDESSRIWDPFSYLVTKIVEHALCGSDGFRDFSLEVHDQDGMGSVWLPGRYLSDKSVAVTSILLPLAQADSTKSSMPGRPPSSAASSCGPRRRVLTAAPNSSASSSPSGGRSLTAAYTSTPYISRPVPIPTRSYRWCNFAPPRPDRPAATRRA